MKRSHTHLIVNTHALAVYRYADKLKIKNQFKIELNTVRSLQLKNCKM